MQISKKDIFDGISLTTVKTGKFKFNRIFIDFILPLEREHAAENALFTSVLLRGTNKHPNLLSIQKELSSLYGAEIDSYVGTNGEAHVITVYAKLLSDRYALRAENITGGVTALLTEIIKDPKTQDGIFDEAYVESEKDKLITDIEAQINEKDAFALKRCTEIMCANEAWGVSEIGKIEDVEKITSASLFERYKYVLSHAKTEVWVIGDIEEASAEEFVRNTFADVKRCEIPDYSTDVVKDVKEVKSVCEHQALNQGKLVLGFRTGIGGYEEDYNVLRVLNGIFGSGTQSKLFRNVREKLSLCYHCSSRIYAKGVMMVTSGIEVSNREKARNEILFQLEEIKKGNITEEELASAKKRVRNAFLSVDDSADAIHSHYASAKVFGSQASPADLIEKTERVTIEQVVAAAQNIRLDTEYFLCGMEGEQ